MKHVSFHILIFIFCFQVPRIIWAQDKTPAWEKKSDFKGGRTTGTVSFSVGQKRYVCLGTDGSTCKKECWEYNSANDSWKRISDFPGEPRTQAVAFSIGDKGYVGTGYYDEVNERKAKKDFWEYNPATDTWTVKADLPGDARHGAIGFSIGDKGYVGLGATPGKIAFCNDLWEYNPGTNQWIKKADFPEKGKDESSVFVINNIAYVLLGGKSGEIAATSKNVWEYNSIKNTWEAGTEFPGLARIGALAFSIDKKGYICAGNNGVVKYYNDLWEYDSKMKIWIQKPDANFDGRYCGFAFVVGNVAYIGTGVKKQILNSSGSNDVWSSSFTTQINVDYNAKLLYEDKNKKLPLAKQGISLVGDKQNVIETTVTDNSGLFAFKELDATGKYELVLDKNDKIPANAVVTIAKQNGRIIQELTKNADGQFTYELPKLDEIVEDDSYFNLNYFTKSADKEITITSNIYYPGGSAELSKEAKTTLYQVVVSLNQYPNLTVVISSHTDSQGDDAFNMQLSEKRAKTALDYIILNGIEAKRISAKGYGETKIINKCKNGVTCIEEEHKANRRTEFKFMKP